MRNNSLSSENELLNRLREGDEEAFSEIYNRYWEKLLAVAFFHTREKQSAEDIVHDVMLSLWTRKSELHIEALSAYLAKGVKFAVFKAIMRGKKRRDHLYSQEQSLVVSDIEQKLEAKFFDEHFQKTIDHLPEKTKIIFKYRRVEDLTISQIAQRTELSPKAVEYHITKALRALREKLQKIKILFI